MEVMDTRPTDVPTDVRAVLLSAGISFTAVFLFLASIGFNLVGIGGGSSVLMNTRWQFLLLLPSTDSAKAHWPRLSSPRSSEGSHPREGSSLPCNRWECSEPYCLCKSASLA